ncbi:MAG: hypothetical protein BWY60_00419 [Actinobacteria bacterium ADurb.Bin346]|nr:MAG: hypothetical protein BWY60_00419 [Actinobacteria bacterium ADurb.Bin346]
MPVQQLTVFLENQTGRLAEVTRILKEADINLKGFSTTEARDYGILRLIVSNTETARMKLKEAGFTTHIADAICIKVEDKPGELYKILELLAGEKINIDYIYVIADTRLVLSVSDIEKTESILKKNGAALC